VSSAIEKDAGERDTVDALRELIRPRERGAAATGTPVAAGAANLYPERPSKASI
jgi:hypothetical protein